MAGRVFIVMEPLRRQGNEMVPMMDFRPAAEYGELVVCLSGQGTTALTPGPMVNRLREVLKGFDDDDYLLPAGDPAAMLVAGAIAAEANCGRLRILKWERISKKYIEVQVNIFPGRNTL